MLTAGVKGRVEMFRRLGLAVLVLLVAFGLILKDGKVVIIPDSEEIEMGGIVDERKLAGGPGGC